MSVTLTREDGVVLVFDGYRSISYQPSNTVTSHPVEAGGAISDHAQAEPLRFSIDGAFANPVQQFVAKPLAVETAIQFFESSTGKLISVDTVRDGVFLSCLLEGWSHRQTNQRGRRFDLTFRQVRIATPVSVTIPARTPSPRAGSGMADEVDAGQQTPTPVGPQEAQSTAAAATDLGDAALNAAITAVSSF